MFRPHDLNIEESLILADNPVELTQATFEQVRSALNTLAREVRRLSQFAPPEHRVVRWPEGLV